MIKSSDKKFNNTYRLLKVLANKDYLAIDLTQNFFLFCAASKMPSSSAIPNDKKYLLKHRECIIIDNLKYYVFQIGANPPVWARNMDRKIIAQEINVFLMFRHAVGNILSNMLWYEKPRQAREWLDVRNCWLLDGQLYLLMLPRALKPSLGVRRSETRHSSLDSSSASEIFQCQSSLLRDFGLMMWEIIEQKPYSSGDVGACPCKLVSKLMLQMIYRQTRFEDVQNQLTDCPQIQPRIKLKHKSRFSTVNTLSCDKKRGSLQSVQLTKQARSLKQSKFANMYTQVINRKYHSPQSAKVQKGQSDHISRPVEKPSQSRLQNHRSMSVQSHDSFQSNQKKIEFRKSRYTLKSRLSTQNTQETTKYQWWLKNKKYSFNIEEKIKRQEATAQQKFNRTIEQKLEDSPSPYDEEKLKLRLLSKVIKFRDRNKGMVDPENRSETQQNDQTKQSSQKKTTLIDFSGCKRISTNFIMNRWKEGSKQQLSKPEETNASPQLDKSRKFTIQKVNNFMVRRSNIFNVNVTSVQAAPMQVPEDKPQSKTIQMTNNIKIENQYYQPKKQAAQKISQAIEKPIEAETRKEENIQEPKQEKPIKIEKIVKKEQSEFQPRKKVRQNVISSQDHQFQQINLQQIKKVREEQKKPQGAPETKKQTLIVSEQKIAKPVVKVPQPPKIIKESVDALINEYITLINVLGDITVKTVKIKDRIQALQWRKGIYFLYQRFQYERGRLLVGLKDKTRTTIRKGRQVEARQWEEWEKSKARVQLIEKISAENITIQQTLKRFALKVVQECKLDRKIEYYIKNRDRFQSQNEKKLRFQLSKQAVSSIVDQFDSVIQKRINARDVINHVLDGLFGLAILRQLDGLPTKNPVRLQDYKEYKYDLRTVSQQADELYYLYFPEEKEKASA